jgi:Rho termination factor, N-terminal domain
MGKKEKTSSDIYLGFIAYFIGRYLGGVMTKHDFADFLTAKLDTSVYHNADEKKLKEMALWCYYYHFLSLTLHAGKIEEYKDKKSSKLKEILVAIEKVCEEYGLTSLSVVYYTSDTKAIEHMEDSQESLNVLDELKPPKNVKATKAKATTTKTKAKATTTKTKKDDKPKKTKKDSDKKSKIDDMSVVELKELAKEKGITGYSKMKKDELITAVKGKKSTTTKPTKDTVKSTKTTGTAVMKLSHYSTKAISVTGDTKEFKDKLKALGGKYNAGLTVGPGWIFANKKKAELIKEFGKSLKV